MRGKTLAHTADQAFGRDYQAGVPDNALPSRQDAGGAVMNKLTKIALHCAGCGLAFCAVLISPMILIYSGPLVIGAASDIVHVGGATIAAAFITAGMLWAVA